MFSWILSLKCLNVSWVCFKATDWTYGHFTYTYSNICAGEQDCTSAEPLLSLSGSCHIPAICNTVKTQGIVLTLRIVSQLLSSIGPQSEQLNEALLPLEQWGVKSLASVACVRISIVLWTRAHHTIKCSDMLYQATESAKYDQNRSEIQFLLLQRPCLPRFVWSVWPSPHSIRVTGQTSFGRCSCSK